MTKPHESAAARDFGAGARISRRATWVDNIVAFYVTQKSKPAENGQTLLKEITDKCNRCHAGDRDNSALAIPVINGQEKEYLTLALRAYRDDKRGYSMMHNMSMPYSDSIIESIASYYAGQPAR
jgi:cytochrome c553